MSAKELIQLFDKHHDEYCKFNRITHARSTRCDIHAFLLLNELCPDAGDMVSGAEHDVIYLGVTPDELAAVATEEHVIELRRCGVRYDNYADSLAMFV